MRDLAFHDNDLIVATHGRGFWVLDDISALRQVGRRSPRPTRILFKPADALILPLPSDEGTPTQKDEPAAENPPTGAIVDYYLKTAATRAGDDRDPRRRGRDVRRYSSTDPVAGDRSRDAGRQRDLAAGAGSAVGGGGHAPLRLGSCVRRRRRRGRGGAAAAVAAADAAACRRWRPATSR